LYSTFDDHNDPIVAKASPFTHVLWNAKGDSMVKHQLFSLWHLFLYARAKAHHNQPAILWWPGAPGGCLAVEAAVDKAKVAQLA